MIVNDQYLNESKPIIVPPAQQFLDIQVETDKETYNPGDEAVFTVKTLDHQGKPVSAEVSVGVVDGHPVLDLDYKEDSGADVDMNLVMTASGGFVEVQGSGEEASFSRAELDALLALGEKGCAEFLTLQREALGL